METNVSFLSRHFLLCPLIADRYTPAPPDPPSPGLEDSSEGSLSNISDILDIIPRILEGQQLGVQQQGDPLVHGVWVKAIQQEL